MQNNNCLDNEHRRNPRFVIDAFIIITDTTNGKSYSGICCNVSSDGLLISCADDLPDSRLLHLEIREKDVIYMADGYVARRAKGNNIFLIGLRVDFHRLNDKFSIIE